MSETREQVYAKMDDAYNDFMGEFTPFLQNEILRLVDKYNLEPDSVLTVTGRGLIELGAMDLVTGIGGARVLDLGKRKVIEFSNNILAGTLQAARLFLRMEGVR